MKKTIYTALCAATLLVGVSSCQRYLDITPTGVVVPTTYADFRALMTKAYSAYPQHKARVAVRSDEVFLNANSSLVTNVKDIYIWNDASPDQSTDQYHYEDFYNSIFYTNYIIENAPQNLVSGQETNQILGEAYALRALNYFELSNLYSDVYTSANTSMPSIPIITVPNLEGTFPKSTIGEVYTQILSDLSKAESLLNVNKHPEGYNYRFSKVAIHALRARVYQYMGDWKNAVAEADKVLAINNSLEDFNAYKMLPNHYQSVESILNLDQNVNSTLESVSFASPELIALYDQTNDLRFAKYFTVNGSNYKTAKYNRENALKSTFRVGEIILIKAEALAKSGDEVGSKTLLLSLAKNRYNAQGLANFTQKINTLSGNAYLQELLNERFRETAYEGLRWFDLRRNGKPAIQHDLEGTIYTLNQGDVRYILQYPKDARRRNPEL